jgi:hypothetical protein
VAGDAIDVPVGNAAPNAIAVARMLARIIMASPP